MLGMELQSKRTTEVETVELIRRMHTEGELLLEMSLYRITLNCGVFYLISSERVSTDERISAAEILTSDQTRAENVYLRLVEGSVPPSTLHDIVSDLLKKEYNFL